MSAYLATTKLDVISSSANTVYQKNYRLPNGVQIETGRVYADQDERFDINFLRPFIEMPMASSTWLWYDLRVGKCSATPQSQTTIVVWIASENSSDSGRRASSYTVIGRWK